jgi:hypothetical protein
MRNPTVVAATESLPSQDLVPRTVRGQFSLLFGARATNDRISIIFGIALIFLNIFWLASVTPIRRALDRIKLKARDDHVEDPRESDFDAWQ